MPTYRCKSCKGLYVDPQPSGVSYYHVCGPMVRDDQGDLVPTPHPRDETIQVDFIMGKDIVEGRAIDASAPMRIYLKNPGLGRELIDKDDVLSTVTAAQLAELQKRPGEDVPDPPAVMDPFVAMARPAPPAPAK